MNKLKIGQKVYITPSYADGKLLEDKITKIGRKYIHTVLDKFYRESLEEVENFAGTGKLYFSKEEYTNEKKKERLIAALKLFSSSYMIRELPLGDLEKITQVIGNNKLKIGYLLKSIRISLKDENLYTMACKLGMSTVELSQIENNKIKIPENLLERLKENYEISEEMEHSIKIVLGEAK